MAGIYFEKDAAGKKHPSSFEMGKSLKFTVKLGYCPHPATVHIRGPIKGYI